MPMGMMLRPMQPIAPVVLFSTLLLITACKKETATLTPITPPTVSADGPKKPEAPKPQVKAAPESKPAPAATTSVADLPKVLAGIKDAPTAEAAKAPLDSIVQQLQTAKNAAPAAASKDAFGGLGKLAGDAAAKLGVSADTVATVGTLLANPTVKAVIGPTLEKLQGLLK